LEACQFADFWQVFGQIEMEAAASDSMKKAAASPETQSKFLSISYLSPPLSTLSLVMVG
jgi:hypothetical protein